jgi:exodeoxyribonuclease VII large subunit
MGFHFENTNVDESLWTVGDLTSYIREMFEVDFRLQDVRVSGELSNFSEARSGHVYFTIKDQQAQLRCVMWRSAASRIRVWPEDGDAVIVGGRISVYEAGGAYQMYAESLTPLGRGQLAEAFEQLKHELAAQGMFDAEHKKQTPSIPGKIGVVTSVDAAALRDILNVLNRRWPAVSVLVAPTLVQGSEAPRQIVQALRWLDGRDDIDLIILARGGGSIEDLWAFNDEMVAKSIFEAYHPIIVGVGHETDFTIADFVADVRAPTPSAAAELAVPDRNEFIARADVLQIALVKAILALIDTGRMVTGNLLRSLNHMSPQSQVDGSRQRVDWLAGRLEKEMTLTLERYATRLNIAEAAMGAISPLRTLLRGYAIVRSRDDEIVHRVGDVVSGESLQVQVSDGEFGVTVD